jgi:hypothetical protein
LSLSIINPKTKLQSKKAIIVKDSMIYPQLTHPNKIFHQSSRNNKISWGIHNPFLRTTNSNIIIITNRSVVNKILRYRWQSDIHILAITVSMEMMDMIMRRVLDCHKVVSSRTQDGEWGIFRSLSFTLFSLGFLF